MRGLHTHTHLPSVSSPFTPKLHLPVLSPPHTHPVCAPGQTHLVLTFWVCQHTGLTWRSLAPRLTPLDRDVNLIKGKGLKFIQENACGRVLWDLCGVSPNRESF